MEIELTARPWLLALALAALCACSAPAFEKPQPPDMADLLRRYDSPDGSFNPDDAEAVGLLVMLFDETLGDTDIVGRVAELLNEVTDLRNLQRDLTMQEDAPFQLSLQADGFAVLTRICAGWTLPSVVDPANGNAVVTATFSEAGVDPVVWGTVSACRYRVADTLIELTPSSDRDAFRLYWGEEVSGQRGSLEGALLSLALRADVNGDTIDLDLDVRLASDDSLEYLLPTEQGTVVVRSNGDGTFAVRSVEGSFECDEAYACARIEPGAGDAP
jgi:hypothetical protein